MPCLSTADANRYLQQTGGRHAGYLGPKEARRVLGLDKQAPAIPLNDPRSTENWVLAKWVQHLRLGAVPMGSEVDLEIWEARSEKLIAATAVGLGMLLSGWNTNVNGKIFALR